MRPCMRALGRYERGWLNGALLDASVARIDPADAALRSGTGFRNHPRGRGTPAHIARHFARMRNGAAVLGNRGAVRGCRAVRSVVLGAAGECAAGRGAAVDADTRAGAAGLLPVGSAADDADQRGPRVTGTLPPARSSWRSGTGATSFKAAVADQVA